MKNLHKFIRNAFLFCVSVLLAFITSAGLVLLGTIFLVAYNSYGLSVFRQHEITKEVNEFFEISHTASKEKPIYLTKYFSYKDTHACVLLPYNEGILGGGRVDAAAVNQTIAEAGLNHGWTYWHLVLWDGKDVSVLTSYADGPFRNIEQRRHTLAHTDWKRFNRLFPISKFKILGVEISDCVPIENLAFVKYYIDESLFLTFGVISNE